MDSMKPIKDIYGAYKLWNNIYWDYGDMLSELRRYFPDQLYVCWNK